jgi:hypothetical protein
MDSTGDRELAKGGTLDVLDQLAELGFVHTFKLDKGHLCCVESDECYRPKDLKLCGLYRFEGISDPDDSRVIYAIEARDGTRGTVVDAFGTYASPELAELLENVYDARTEMNIMQLVPAAKAIEIRAR